MKKYQIEVNERQLSLLHSAVELQLRVRFGQGWAIIENILPITASDYRTIKDAYDPVLDTLMRRIAIDPYTQTMRACNAVTSQEERDMWVSFEQAIGYRQSGEVPLSKYGFLNIKEITDSKE